MKILHVITGLGRGGAESMLVRLLSASRNCRAVVSLTGRGVHAGDIESLGVPVYSLGMRPGLPDPLGLLRLRRIVREFDPDVIHGWMYHGALLALMAAPDRPQVVAIHHSLKDIRTEKFLTRQVITLLARMSRKRGHIVYCSITGRGQHEALGFNSARAHVIPNGFDTDEFRPDLAVRSQVRQELGIGDDRFVVLHAARFHPMKNHAGMLAAARELSGDPRYVFLLAGTGVTPENPALTPHLTGAPLERVRLLGERGDVRRLMAAVDIFCVSSGGEAFPLVLGEAMACGLPCVATDVGDAGHIVNDTGIIVPPGNQEALTAAIRRLGDLSAEERAALGQRARARIVENFSLEKVAKGYLDIYRVAFSDRPAPELGTIGRQERDAGESG